MTSTATQLGTGSYRSLAPWAESEPTLPLHHGDVSTKRRRVLFEEAHVLSIRYYRPEPPVNASDRHVPSRRKGLNLFTRIIWYRGKAKINRALSPTTPKPPPIRPSSPLPPELVGMILTYLTHDTEALKACSLTCYTWYTAVVPHLHRTFVFRDADCIDRNRGGLKPLSRWHALGLLPLAKEVRILQSRTQPRWFLPQSFNRRKLHYFSAFTNVQSLTLQQPDIRSFIPRIERYFGHFSPTLRSITLESPRCSPRQLSHFLSLFTNLDDVDIKHFVHVRADIPDAVLPPLSTPKLRGQLTLSSFTAVDMWEDLAASCGLRFRCIYLYPVSKCAPVLLSACAETLETLRLEPDSEAGWFYPSLIDDFNLSRLKVLRSLQIKPPATFLRNLAQQKPPSDFLTTIESIFYTITSSVFTELVIVIQSGEVYYLPWRMYGTLRRMYHVRPFKLVFLLIASEKSSELVVRRTWEGAVNTATAKGLLSFLESPPTIHFTRRGTKT